MNTITALDPFYDAGNFKVGDRVRMTADAYDTRHVGALGTVKRIDDGEGEIFPVIVWLDIFGDLTPAEVDGLMGIPLCASEIEKVAK